MDHIYIFLMIAIGRGIACIGDYFSRFYFHYQHSGIVHLVLP